MSKVKVTRLLWVVVQVTTCRVEHIVAAALQATQRVLSILTVSFIHLPKNGFLTSGARCFYTLDAVLVCCAVHWASIMQASAFDL